MSEAADTAVLREAAHWFAVMNDEQVSEVDRQRWQAWHDAHPSHGSAWSRVEQMRQRFTHLPPATDRAAAVNALAAVRVRRRAMKALAVTGGVGLAGWFAAESNTVRTLTADARTGVGETRAMALPDGSRVWLNTASALDIAHGASLRRLVLRAGEVLVETAAAHDARPFVVDVPQGRLVALGTRFSVRDEGDCCGATVFEGQVEVRPANGGAPRRIAAGEQLSFDLTGDGTVRPASAGREAWTRGMLLADNLTLGEFLAELSSHHHGVMTCADDVAALRLVGAFPLADLDAVLAVLERTLPVVVRRPLPGWVRVGSRPTA